MFTETTGQSQSRGLADQLADARRQLKAEERRLAQLKYEWYIAKRLRNQARSEEEREKWRVQSDAYLGLVMQQEGVIEEINARIDRHRSTLAELDQGVAGEARR
jgi:hypothetical protein